MKKIISVLLVLLCLCGCNSEIESEKQSPKPEYVFTYTPIIDIFSFDNKGEVSFIGYSDGSLMVEYGGDKRFTGTYNIETKEFFDITGTAVFYPIERNGLAINGYETFIEEKNGSFLLYAMDYENPDKRIQGPLLKSEAVFSAYDGENFYWSCSEGLFIRKNGKDKLIADYCGKFALLADNFIIWPDSENEKIGLYRIDKDYTGGYTGFPGLSVVMASDEIIVFKNENPNLGEEYLSITIKRSQEPNYDEKPVDAGPYSIVVDGYLYYCYYENSHITPEENQIKGKITSVYDDLSTCPRRNDQANIIEFLGKRYAIVDGELLLEDTLGSGENPITVWYKCTKSWELSEINFPD